MKTIGAYEAKTHLPRLLDEVAAGERIIITKRGVPVARPLQAGLDPLIDRHEAIRHMREFGRGRKLDGLCIAELIAEGRR